MHFSDIILPHSHPRIETTCILYLFCAVDEYLYVANAPGQQLTEAQTRTPLLGPTGPACTLSFDFALAGNLNHIGKRLNASYGFLCFQKAKHAGHWWMWVLQGSCPSGWLTACWACSRNCGDLLERREPTRRHGSRSTWRSEPESIVSRSALLSKLQCPPNSSALP